MKCERVLFKKKKKIKTMNNKMAINTDPSTTESNKKKKLSKQEQRQNHGYGDNFDGCQMGDDFRRMGQRR